MAEKSMDNALQETRLDFDDGLENAGQSSVALASKSTISSKFGLAFSRDALGESGVTQDTEDIDANLAGLYRDDDLSFTWRATILGSIFGTFINVANTYLGLKVGIGIGATLFATLLGTVTLGPFVKLMGGQLGIREHTCFQAAGTASGGMCGGLVAPVLVLFWNGFFPNDVGSHIGELLGLIFGAAGFGLVYAVSLRQLFVVKQKLIFPTGTAAAEVMLTMYISRAGAEEGKKKVKVMLAWFLFSFLYAIVTFFMPILVEIPIFRYLSNCPVGVPFAQCKEMPNVYTYFVVLDSLQYRLNLNPIFIGSGMMIGPSVNSWFAIGATLFPILSWSEWERGFVGPNPSFAAVREMVMMWPSVISMLTASIMGILLQYEVFISLFKTMFSKVEVEENKEAWQVERDRDTPWYFWMPLLGISIAFTFIVYLVVFGNEVSWWQVVVGVATTYPIAIVTTQIAGSTGWTISATLGQFGMMVLGGIGSSANSMLLIGNMISQSASQAGEVVMCYKTAYLVNAAPAAQFVAQIFGTIFGGFVSVLALWLYTAAYPCILDPNDPECSFATAAARAWQVLSNALANGISVGNDPSYTMTELGMIYTILFPILTVVSMLATHFVIPPRFHWVFPMWSVFYLSWIISPMFSYTQFFGQCILWLWEKMDREAADMLKFSVASGLLAGGSVATIVTAVFDVVGLPSLNWGRG